MYILYHLFLKIVSLSQSFYTSSIPSPLFIFTFFFIYTKTHCLYSDEVESTGLKPMGSLAEPFWSGHHNRRLFLEILTLFIEHYYIFFITSAQLLLGGLREGDYVVRISDKPGAYGLEYGLAGT